MTRSEILDLMNHVLEKRSKSKIIDENQTVREVNFKSLDFSEVALRIETSINEELFFDAATMRNIKTVKDVLDFFESLTSNYSTQL